MISYLFNKSLPIIVYLSLISSYLSFASTSNGIHWELSYDTALLLSKEHNKPIFVTIHLNEIKTCNKLLKEHYSDKRIINLTKDTVNLYASISRHTKQRKKCPIINNDCDLHINIENKIRHMIQESSNTDYVITPMHIFLDSNGKTILSVPYMLTIGELEWSIVEAIRILNPDYSYKLSPDATPPKRLLYGKIETLSDDDIPKHKPAPLIKSELQELVPIIRGKVTYDSKTKQTIERLYDSLLLTESKEAMSLVSSWLNGKKSLSSGYTLTILRDIGISSPPCYWEIVAPFISNNDDDIRREAIVVLEKLSAPASLKILKKQYSVERNIEIKGILLQALASVGNNNKSTVKMVLKTADNSRSKQLQVNAILGLIHILNSNKVIDILNKYIVDKHIGCRAACTYVIAIRRERNLIECLRKAYETESDPDCKYYMESAMKALEGGDIDLLEGIRKQYTKDDIPRIRNY